MRSVGVAAVGLKRDSRRAFITSLNVRFGSKADIAAPPTNVRFTPKSRHWNSVSKCRLCAKSRHSALRQRLALFDHLVGTRDQRLRHGESECLRGFEIDYQLILCRRLYRQIARLLAFEDAIDIASRAPEHVRAIRSVGNQAAILYDNAVV